MMHLSLVPKRTFDFNDADFEVPIPSDALASYREDAPGPNTPLGLEDFRYFLTDAACAPQDASHFVLALASLCGGRAASVVPLVTPLYAATKAHEVFSAWQFCGHGRNAFKLVISGEGGRAGALTIALRREEA